MISKKETIKNFAQELFYVYGASRLVQVAIQCVRDVKKTCHEGDYDHETLTKAEGCLMEAWERMRHTRYADNTLVKEVIKEHGYAPDNTTSRRD